MSLLNVKVIGLAEFKRAIKRNPASTRKEFDNFLTRAFAIYKRGIGKNPWRMGSSSGGSPVASGNLRQSHRTKRKPFYGSIFPTAPYASYVHGTGGKKTNVRGVQLRPWLTFALQDNDRFIDKELDKMLTAITKDLAK